jgi:alpha-L-fucosidase 2
MEPFIWPTGHVTGLRARGGFEVVDMQWKDGKLTKLTVKSNLGGNLRLRAPNALKTSGKGLTAASGQNPNLFYATDDTPAPVVSPQADKPALTLKETLLYDMPTQAGKVYTLVAQ